MINACPHQDKDDYRSDLGGGKCSTINILSIFSKLSYMRWLATLPKAFSYGLFFLTPIIQYTNSRQSI